MYGYALINPQGKCINATLSENEEVRPQGTNKDKLVAISEEQFHAGVIDKYYHDGVFEEYNNKKLTLLTPGPYMIGDVSLQWQQQTLTGDSIVELAEFTIEVNGRAQTILVEDGIVEVELSCPTPMSVQLKITADRYKDVEMLIPVEEVKDNG